jgi:hypothetical protein
MTQAGLKGQQYTRLTSQLLLVCLHMAKPKPFVAVACVCERVLQEKDNVNSVVRIVDTFNIEMPQGLPPGIKPAVPITLFVSLKSGDVTGAYDVELRLKSPSGKTSPTLKWPVALGGGEQGVNAVLNVTIAEPEFSGIYWMDVVWESEMLTSIPFKLRLVSTQPEGSLSKTH